MCLLCAIYLFWWPPDRSDFLFIETNDFLFMFILLNLVIPPELNDSGVIRIPHDPTRNQRFSVYRNQRFSVNVYFFEFGDTSRVKWLGCYPNSSRFVYIRHFPLVNKVQYLRFQSQPQIDRIEVSALCSYRCHTRYSDKSSSSKTRQS